MKKLTVLILLTATFSAPAWAATKTIVLSVSGMTCAACPITVKKALEKVSGVSAVKVDYDKKTATVTYDADKTKPDALTHATTDAGFPSTVRK